jgi:hypothetical protein
MTEPTTPEAPLNLQKRLADKASAPGNGVPADPLVDLALVDVTVEAGLRVAGPQPVVVRAHSASCATGSR